VVTVAVLGVATSACGSVAIAPRAPTARSRTALVGGSGYRTHTQGRRPDRSIFSPEAVLCRLNQRHRFNARSIIGLPKPMAVRVVREHGCTWRTVEVDGRGLIITSDKVSGRIDVSLRHNRVSAVTVG
jgi:hypothetical protein